MLTIPIMSPQTDESRKMFLEDLKACNADAVLLVQCEIFEEGNDRKKIFSELKKNIEYYTSEGFATGIWTTTLGWGSPREKNFYDKFSNAVQITSFSGQTTTAVCPLNEDFTLYMEKNMEDIARTGTSLILLDDELVLSVRPGFTCACELHRKEFAKKTGREWTGEELQELFTKEPNEYRTAWMDFTGETLINFSKRMRAAVDRVDPTIRMGLCASFTHFDLDGFNVRDIVKILAGEGNKPYFRLSGAAYWPVIAPRFPGMKISGVMEFVRMQSAWLEDTDFELLDENDSFPRTDEVPAGNIEIYDKVSLTQTRFGRLKYILHYGQEKEGELSFLNEHLKNMPTDKKISAFFANKTPIGWRIFCAEQKIRAAVLPEKYLGDLNLMARFTMPYSGILAAVNGFPTKYSGKGPTIVFGEDARHLPKESANEKILADRTAAEILTAREISCIELDTDTYTIDFEDAPDISEILKEAYPELPFTSKGIYILASENEAGDEMAILLTNDKNEKIENIEVSLCGEYSVIDTANGTAKIEGNKLLVESINALDFISVLLKKIK